MIRLFQFKNNFLSKYTEKLVAEYSIIGYFDGLDMKTDKDMNLKKTIELLNDPMQIEISKSLNEMCDYFNIAGIRCDDDTEFWQFNDHFFVFISCVRLQKKSTKLFEIIKKIETDYNAVCYTTLDSSDLVICLKSKSYYEGYEAIENYHRIIEEYDKDNGLQKGFSLLAIHQCALNGLLRDEKPWMSDEKLCCILRIVVKDWKEINNYLDELKSTLKIQKCETYGLLGSEDIMVELKDVQSKDWFSLYADNGLLTHGNLYYNKAFYNIRTEILVKREDGDLV